MLHFLQYYLLLLLEYVWMENFQTRGSKEIGKTLTDIISEGKIIFDSKAILSLSLFLAAGMLARQTDDRRGAGIMRYNVCVDDPVTGRLCYRIERNSSKRDPRISIVRFSKKWGTGSRMHARAYSFFSVYPGKHSDSTQWSGDDDSYRKRKRERERDIQS